jgi:phosphate transport system substrate-binding protein
MARIARPLRQNEIDQGLQYTIFGLTPVVLIIHQSVTGIDTVSPSQVRDIFSGNITRWNELGGPDEKIYLVNREDGDSSMRALENSIPGFQNISPPQESVFYSTPEAMEALAKYPYTIGYGPLTMVPETNVRCLQLNGVMPSPENLQNGTYPLSTQLGMVWKGELPQRYRDFMEFLSTPAAEQIIRAYGASLSAHHKGNKYAQTFQ